MKLNKFITALLLFLLFTACKNASENNVEDTQKEEPEFAGANETDDESSGIDILGDLEDNEWEMDEETRKGFEKFESILEGIETFTTEANYDLLLNKHQLDRAKFDEALATANAKLINKYGKVDPKEKAAAMVDFVQETIEGSGLEISKEQAASLIAAHEKSEEQLLTSKHNVQGTNKQVRKILEQNDVAAEDNYLSENLSIYDKASNKKRITTLLKLTEATSREETKTILAEHYEITKSEVELLEQFPKMLEPVPSSNVAHLYFEYTPPKEIKEHLESGKATGSFVKIIDVAIQKKRTLAKQFIDEAAKASKKFAKENPSYFKEGNVIENTYVDQRGNYIYLPLGERSFADVVIDKKLGKQGTNEMGSLHYPDMSTKQFREVDDKICNLGLGGQLTLAFTDNALSNVNGPDLYVFEMGAIEPTNLEISKDGKEWIQVGKIDGGTAMVDIKPFVNEGDSFNYVRLTDLKTHSGIPGADIDAVAAIGGAMMLNIDSSVLFDSGKYKLKVTANKALDDLVKTIEVFPSGTITVEGHTDNDGSPSSNKILSLKRAEEVSKYIEKKLSKKFKFKQVGMGETQPIAPNDSPKNKQRNRRVEILVSPRN